VQIVIGHTAAHAQTTASRAAGSSPAAQNKTNPQHQKLLQHQENSQEGDPTSEGLEGTPLLAGPSVDCGPAHILKSGIQQLTRTQRHHARRAQISLHKTRHNISTSSCCSAAQTHKVEILKAWRELHSSQVLDLIFALRTSSSGIQQLTRTQRHHAQRAQAPLHKTRQNHSTSSCCSTTQTHESESLKAWRELHSLQVHNFIVTLCKSSSGIQQLMRTQRHHAQRAQASLHKTRQNQSTSSCCRTTRTHEIKSLKAWRELHSLQVHNFIVTLCTSSSGIQKLTRTQRHHARWAQIPLHKTRQNHSTSSCCSTRKTHKIESLKAWRELHSLQIPNAIAVLCTSSSGIQQLTRTQRHHARGGLKPR
jgi:hypothetical protein